MHAITTPNQAEAALAVIRTAIVQSADIDQVRTFRDQAEAVRHYLKTAAAHLSLQNQAAEVKLVAERQIGLLLHDVCRRGGDRRSRNRNKESELEKFGLSRSKSSRYQLEGSLPEEDFARYVRETNAQGRELTSNGLIRLAKLHVQAAGPRADAKNPFARIISGLRGLARNHQQFACIYADPPWSRDSSNAEIARMPNRLCELPVKAVVAKNAHAHLWIPPHQIESGLGILRAWGFRCRDCLVRSKLPDGYHQYWRHAHDILLLGICGQLSFRDTDLSSWLDGADLVGRNGSEIYSLIGRASSPPFLELFGIKAAGGWSVPCP